MRVHVSHTIVIAASIIIAVFMLSCSRSIAQSTVYLDTLELENIQQEWGKPAKNLSVDGRPLSIGGKVFTRGVGTHAQSVCVIDLKKSAFSWRFLHALSVIGDRGT